MSLSHYLLLTLLFDIVTLIYGWGSIGHSIIVRLAQSQLVDSAPDWIRSLTPWHWNGNLSAMASWADIIMYSNLNPTGFDNWQWSRELHYLNTPDWTCEYTPDRDCINDRCIVGAIKNFTKRLQTEHDEIQQKEALYFLIHFMGDIHQPLHTGFKGDRGGNDVRGYFMNSKIQTNLHSIWDTDLIMNRLERYFQWNVSHYYDYIYQIMMNEISADSNNNKDDNGIEQWVKQNINVVCSQAYFDENNMTMNSSVNFNLGEVYYQRNIPIVEKRLAVGGRRLGALLNRLAKTRPKKPSDSKGKIYFGTIALIVIACLEGILAIIGISILWFRPWNKLSWPLPSMNLKT